MRQAACILYHYSRHNVAHVRLELTIFFLEGKRSVQILPMGLLRTRLVLLFYYWSVFRLFFDVYLNPQKSSLSDYAPNQNRTGDCCLQDSCFATITMEA